MAETTNNKVNTANYFIQMAPSHNIFGLFESYMYKKNITKNDFFFYENNLNGKDFLETDIYRGIFLLRYASDIHADNYPTV